MAGSYPGPEGMTGRPRPNVRDQTSALIASPTQGAIGLWADATYDAAVKRLMGAATWLDTQPLAVNLLGGASFSAGVTFGVGESLVSSVVELADLVKVFILADLYEQQATSSWEQVLKNASWGPFAGIRYLGSQFANKHYHAELKDAHEQREALVEALRYAFSNPGEVFSALKQEYIDKWNKFEKLSIERRLSARFRAGEIFGEILLEILGLIAGGAGIARALATKFPKLAKLLEKMKRAAEGLTRWRSGSKANDSADPKLQRSKEKPQGSPSPTKGKLAAGTPEHKADRWQRYQDRGGKWDYDRWSKQYDTNMQNYQRGLEREIQYRQAMGANDVTLKTPYTDRQIDIYKPAEDYLGQLKTGKVSLTQENIVAIKKDAWFVKEGYTVEHILEQGASKNYLDALDKAGIKYLTGPQLP